MGYFIGVDLVEHSLSFLEQYQRLLVLVLRYKIEGAFVELVDDHWDLVLLQVEVFVVIFLK